MSLHVWGTEPMRVSDWQRGTSGPPMGFQISNWFETYLWMALQALIGLQWGSKYRIDSRRTCGWPYKHWSVSNGVPNIELIRDVLVDGPTSIDRSPIGFQISNWFETYLWMALQAFIGQAETLTCCTKCKEWPLLAISDVRLGFPNVIVTPVFLEETI